VHEIADSYPFTTKRLAPPTTADRSDAE
jgi:hypothetical protein